MKTKVTIEEVSAAIITGLLMLAAVWLFTGCAVVRTSWGKVNSTVVSVLDYSERVTTNTVNTAPIKQEIVK